jgi:hypothetical protein
MWVKNIQTAGYNGARMVTKVILTVKDFECHFKKI